MIRKIKKHILFTGLSTYHLLNNFRFYVQNITGIRITTSGNVLTRSKQESLERIEFAAEKIFKYGMSEKEIKGKELLEIGPGDNLGLALILLSKGAKKITCVDKFSQSKDKSREQQFYKDLIERMSEKEQKIAKKAFITKGKERILDPNKIKYIYGVGIEEFKGNTKFDFIVSNSVMEHVQDVPKTFTVMDSVLKSKGKMIHSIDFRDHGMYTTLGLEPTTFLTIPKRTWKLMTKHTGRPNRELVRTYKRIMENLKYNYTYFIAGIMWKKPLTTFLKEIKKGRDYSEQDLKKIRKARKHFSKEFRNYSDEELLINQIVLVGEKR